MSEMFLEMRKAALKRLSHRNPREIAQLSGGMYCPDRNEMKITSLGKTYRLSLPEYSCTPELAPWHYLVLLHYIDLADGTPISSQLCTFGALKSGLIRGTEFDRASARMLSQLLDGISPHQIREICAAMGGEEISSNADFAAVLPFFPRLPLTLQVWFADEEFPVSGKLLLPQSADHYITIEDAVTVGEVLLDQIKALSQPELH